MLGEEVVFDETLGCWLASHPALRDKRVRGATKEEALTNLELLLAVAKALRAPLDPVKS
jgi:predicted RNase H-like HicB family nuclease